MIALKAHWRIKLSCAYPKPNKRMKLTRFQRAAYAQR